MGKKRLVFLLSAILVLLCCCTLEKNPLDDNFPDKEDETSWDDYVFPSVTNLSKTSGIADVFKMTSGRVESKTEWEEQKIYLKAALSHYIYGKVPKKPKTEELLVTPLYKNEDGSIINEMFKLTWGRENCFSADVRLCYPKYSEKIPVIFRLDYLADYEFRIKSGNTEMETDLVRAVRYAFVTVGRHAVAPDTSAVKTVLPYTLYPELDMGAIALWGQSAMIALDYLLVNYEFIDSEKLAVSGHSRDGKAALYAAAFDERFTVALPNCSGLGGAAPFKVTKGGSETIDVILSGKLKSWFCDELLNFLGNNLSYLPVDTGSLFALMDNRYVLCSEAKEDSWANPFGTYGNILAGREVKKYLSKYQTDIRMVVSNGSHDENAVNWTTRIAFCDTVFYYLGFPYSDHSENISLGWVCP